jgi:hypothetical protein
VINYILASISTAWTRAVQRRARDVDGDWSPLRDELLIVARGELGFGEEVANNAGPHVARWRGDTKRAAWCAALVSWCYVVASRNLRWSLPFAASHGAKALHRRIGKAGRFSTIPIVGGVVCFERGLDGDWRGHIEIVESVDEAAGVYVAIAGNVGAYPAKVRRRTHRIDGRGERLIGFAAI